MRILLPLVLSISTALAGPAEDMRYEEMLQHIKTLDQLLPAAESRQVRSVMDGELDALRSKLVLQMRASSTPQPPRAVTMPDAELNAILEAIRNVAGRDEKLKILEIAAGRRQFRVDQLMLLVEAFEARPARPVRPEPPARPQAVPPGDFQRILLALDDADFSDEKLSVLRSAAATRHFLVDQVIAVLGKMTFDSDKIEAAALLHSRVVDRTNWYKVYGALDFDSSRAELKQRVGDR